MHDSLEMLIPDDLDLDVWNFDPEINFWADLGRESQSCLSRLKIGTQGISRMLILNPTLVSGIPNPKFVFGEIWTEKIEVVCFVWKLAHMVSLEVLIPDPDLDSWNSDSKIDFLANLG